jgi:hypothetical protein
LKIVPTSTAAAGKWASGPAGPDVEEDRRDTGIGNHWLGKRDLD